MSSSFLDVSAALDQQLNAMAGLPDVAWDNFEYEPALGVSYLRPTLIPGDTLPDTIGANGEDLSIGIYQIDIFTEAGEGKNAGMVLADLIGDQFKHGTQMTYNGSTVEVKTVSQKQAVNNADGWYQAIVEIVYFSFTARR